MEQIDNLKRLTHIIEKQFDSKIMLKQSPKEWEQLTLNTIEAFRIILNDIELKTKSSEVEELRYSAYRKV